MGKYRTSRDIPRANRGADVGIDSDAALGLRCSAQHGAVPRQSWDDALEDRNEDVKVPATALLD